MSSLITRLYDPIVKTLKVRETCKRCCYPFTPTAKCGALLADGVVGPCDPVNQTYPRLTLKQITAILARTMPLPPRLKEVKQAAQLLEAGNLLKRNGNYFSLSRT